MNRSTFLFASAALLGTGAIWAALQSANLSDREMSVITGAHAAEKAVIIPAPKIDAPAKGKRAVAIFAGGCFWGVEAVFEHTNGVISASSGYHGGSKATATYRNIGTGRTGHAEAVRVVYDPRKISYGKLMQIFFSVVADPTMLNAQGPDRGTQYRSALIPLNKSQARAARAYIKQLNRGKYWKRPIVTRLESYRAFYRAETYHQNFIQKNPRQGYVVRWDKPKIANLKRHFPKQYRARPVS